jgi:transposase
MFIRVSKSKYNLDSFVYLVESYRDLNGKPKQRVLKSYGPLSELVSQNISALEELKIWAKTQTKSNQEVRYTHIQVDLSAVQSGNHRLLNYGYKFLESIYNQLSISSFIESYQRDQAFKYDLDNILKLLVFSRALNPESKKKTFEKKGYYFFELKDFSLDDVYRSLDHLTALKDDLMIHLNDELKTQGLRDASLVFYDVTNYYFESVEFDGFRERGVSKENKETGIVQMGLFIDNKGIPITYELFPGNTHDLATMRPILEKIKKQFNLGKLTIVADKGNNSAQNLAMIESYGDDYIIAQRIRNRGNTYANIVLDEADYVYNADQTFKYKLVSFDKEVKLDDGSIKVIPEHLMCFWSRDEELYQRAKRGLLEDKIEKFINEPSLLNASNSFGIKKYFKKVKIDKKTGEVLKGKDVYLFNKDKYERDLALDGYYTIVTNNLELHPFDIIKHYRQLAKIEESFKVTKTDLEGRPVYVWKESHIKGHFLTCYLALLFYRILQIKLDNKYPVHQIKEALNSANAIKYAKDILILIETNTLLKKLSAIHQMDIDYETMRVEKFKKEMKKIV